MRVSGGIYRSRNLESPKGMSVRPTANMVKEALMNMLSGRLRGARVLDLFSGSGQMGIECLSRGASECVFADISRESCALTGQNLKKLGINAKVMNSDWRQTLSSLKARGISFDIIIADPPYQAGLYEDIQQCVLDGLLSEGGVLVLEHDKASPPKVQQGYEVLKERAYGRRCLMILSATSDEFAV